ncbi:hypothetical protein [Sphingobium aquiterrae]|uniref:hypothetical protein n=1 Tax=Sphingobium aquiterrae TaxID=2038656 RepID=UPI0030163902
MPNYKVLTSIRGLLPRKRRLPVGVIIAVDEYRVLDLIDIAALELTTAPADIVIDGEGAGVSPMASIVAMVDDGVVSAEDRAAVREALADYGAIVFFPDEMVLAEEGAPPEGCVLATDREALVAALQALPVLALADSAAPVAHFAQSDGQVIEALQANAEATITLPAEPTPTAKKRPAKVSA